jgi:hypothetical protein
MTVNPRSVHPDGGWPFLDPAVSLLSQGHQNWPYPGLETERAGSIIEGNNLAEGCLNR